MVLSAFVDFFRENSVTGSTWMSVKWKLSNKFGRNLQLECFGVNGLKYLKVYHVFKQFVKLHPPIWSLTSIFLVFHPSAISRIALFCLFNVIDSDFTIYTMIRNTPPLLPSKPCESFDCWCVERTLGPADNAALSSIPEQDCTLKGRLEDADWSLERFRRRSPSWVIAIFFRFANSSNSCEKSATSCQMWSLG